MVKKSHTKEKTRTIDRSVEVALQTAQQAVGVREIVCKRVSAIVGDFPEAEEVIKETEKPNGLIDAAIGCMECIQLALRDIEIAISKL